MNKTASNLRQLSLNGLWHNNPALVQLLGLCPLLAVSSTFVNALGLGLATLLVLLGTNLSVSLVRNYVATNLRLPIFVLIIAALVTCAELLMQAFTYELYQILGIFIPLIVTNCTILGRAEAFASKNPPLPAVVDAFMQGLGFLLVLLVLGSIRELLGQGTLFSGLDLIFGPLAANWQINLFPNLQVIGLLLPPGAFLVLGLLIAAKNWLDARLQLPVNPPAPAPKQSTDQLIIIDAGAKKTN